jgi:hypothetical protein
VKEFIRGSWKIATGFAAGAFFLSLLIGLLTRNPFGIVFVRALLLALLFAILGVALRWAVTTYLPEIATTRAAEGTDAAQPRADARAEASRGSRVDITLDDEAMPGSPGPGVDGEPENAAGVDDADETSQAEAQALGALAEELAEERPGGFSSADEDGAGEAVEEPSELPIAGSAADTATDMDELPDLGPLGGEEPPASRGGRPRAMRASAPGPGERPGDAMRDTMARQDPATLARALRTVLKKDEKG